MTYGNLLSIEIDGRGTVMTCNKVDGAFSWQGQASLGGCIGADSASFFSSVVSGAAGTHMATVMQDAMITTDLSVERGQILSISGGATAAAWGSGGFTLSDGASLSLTDMTVGGRVIVAAGAALTLDSVVMQPGACVGAAGGGQQVILVNTATPEQCLINVVFDDPDPAAFLTNLASGLSGTYVLRVTDAPYTISSLSVGPQQDVRLVSAGGGSVTFTEDVTVAAGASFSINGDVSTILFQGSITVQQGASAVLSVTRQSPSTVPLIWELRAACPSAAPSELWRFQRACARAAARVSRSGAALRAVWLWGWARPGTRWIRPPIKAA